MDGFSRPCGRTRSPTRASAIALGAAPLKRYSRHRRVLTQGIDRSIAMPPQFGRGRRGHLQENSKLAGYAGLFRLAFAQTIPPAQSVEDSSIETRPIQGPLHHLVRGGA